MHVHDNPRAPRETEAAWDIVDAASAQSFPASDPPGWAIGQLYTEEREEETLPDQERQHAPGGSSMSDPEPERPAPRHRHKPG
jgi:hypothetical protein